MTTEEVMPKPPNMRLGEVEKAVLAHVASISGNPQEGIPDFGPGTDRAIDRLKDKGLLAGYSSWEITDDGRRALAQI